MKYLDSADHIIDWLKAILLEIVAGIKGTFHYWDRKAGELEDLVED